MTQQLLSIEACVPLDEKEIEAHLRVQQQRARLNSRVETALRVIGLYYGHEGPIFTAHINWESRSAIPVISDVSGTPAHELAFMGELTEDHPFCRALFAGKLPVTVYSRDIPRNWMSSSDAVVEQFIKQLERPLGDLQLKYPVKSRLTAGMYPFEPLYKPVTLSAPDIDILDEEEL
ncbi:hypothetical protein Dxin01_00102 [Deinococcus xinjiangensis]|uniref:Uncharacterized protein n=1 Tax=Deinococcus xinjiangensis TaxID=457454 RepID=A0ABP9V6R3_9DEIO